VIGEKRPHKGLFPGVEVPWSALGRRASIRDMGRNRVQRPGEREEEERIGDKAHRDVEINDMIFGKRLGKDGMNESTLYRRMERCRSGIIERGTHIYRRLAGGHKAVH
jgi:hypothetical protein